MLSVQILSVIERSPEGYREKSLQEFKLPLVIQHRSSMCLILVTERHCLPD